MARLSRITKLIPIFLLGAFFLVFSSGKIQAQETRHYDYDKIIVNAKVNQDTTVNIEEQQTFNFTGEYHQGWRTVSFEKISGISDVSVIDGETGMALVYSSKELNKEDPSSWNRFTYNEKGNAGNIIWWYNVKDTSHTWIIKYKARGAIGFFDSYDEFYWNLFTDYQVPVRKVEAHVQLPQNASVDGGYFINFYTSSIDTPKKQDISDGKFNYYSQDIKPLEKVTILAQWPKGIVDKSEYRKYLIGMNWGFIFLFLTVICIIISGFGYWYYREKFNRGRNTIIAEYAPPQNLQPAIAEIICKEGISEKTWPATLIDLAVRGYVKIEEEKASKFQIAITWISMTIVFCFIIILTLNCIKSGVSSTGIIIVVFVIVYGLRLGFGKDKLRQMFQPKEYMITKGDLYEKEDGLKKYEKTFLSILFGGENYFSTKELKSIFNASKRKSLYKKMQNLKDELYEEAEIETKAYETKLSAEKIRNTIIISVAAISLIAFSFSHVFLGAQWLAFIMAFICIGLEIIFLKYEARLNREGELLKNDWLGFKLYLETAERDRLQNLTPDLFEKYLPYAIIFGIEKKWAKAFDTLNLKNPDWYRGSYAGVYSAGAVSSSFSPSSFASSFSASFASSFSSSGGAGGAGGGGGGAGGGGGGGGGGAS